MISFWTTLTEPTCWTALSYFLYFVVFCEKSIFRERRINLIFFCSTPLQIIVPPLPSIVVEEIGIYCHISVILNYLIILKKLCFRTCNNQLVSEHCHWRNKFIVIIKYNHTKHSVNLQFHHYMMGNVPRTINLQQLL